MEKSSQADKQQLVDQPDCDKIDTSQAVTVVENKCTGQTKDFEPPEPPGDTSVDDFTSKSGDTTVADSMVNGDADSSLDAINQVNDVRIAGDFQNSENSSENVFESSVKEMNGKIIKNEELQSCSIDEEEQESDEELITGADCDGSSSEENKSEETEFSKNTKSNETVKINAENMKIFACIMIEMISKLYKLYKVSSCSSALQTFFMAILILQSIEEDTSLLKQPYLKQTDLFRYLYLDQRKCFVYAVQYQDFSDLSNPNLPGICSLNNQQGTNWFEGVVYREDVELLQLEANEENNEPHMLEQHINMLGDDNGHSHHENEDGAGRNYRQIQAQLHHNNDAPACGDEAFNHPYRKVNNTAVQIWSHIGPTILSQDGQRSELSLAEITSRFSSSVSTVVVRPDMRRRCERVRTFINQWPHPHLSAEVMADAGFYYKGSEDVTCCDWCGVCIRMWEKDDDPLVEHILLSPDCVYAQRVLENGHVNQEVIEATLMSSSYLTEDLEPGESLQAGEDTLEEGERRHFSVEQTEGETQMFLLDFESGHRPDPHSEQQNDDLNRDSETIVGLSNEIPGLSMEETNYILGNVSSRGDIAIGQQYHSNPVSGRQGARYQTFRAGPYNRTIGTCRGQGATGRNAGTLHDILELDVVKVVLSEGYRRTAVARAVQDLLRVESSLTVDSIKQQMTRNGDK